MIITVTRTVIIGAKRIAQSATAQIDRPIPRLYNITDTARALFDSLDTNQQSEISNQQS